MQQAKCKLALGAHAPKASVHPGARRQLSGAPTHPPTCQVSVVHVIIVTQIKIQVHVIKQPPPLQPSSQLFQTHSLRGGQGKRREEGR